MSHQHKGLLFGAASLAAIACLAPFGQAEEAAKAEPAKPAVRVQAVPAIPLMKATKLAEPRGLQPAAQVACTDGECPTCEACEAGTCTDANCPAKLAAQTVSVELSAAGSDAELGTPTHHQTKILKANQEGLESTKLNCFCMTLDGRVLAGCGTDESNGEIRVFDSNGDYVESWKTPVMVEAINVRASDGQVFVAGNGKLVMLDDAGNVKLEKQSPHASVSEEQAAKMREAVIAQLTQRVEMYKQQAKIYDQQIDTYTEKVKELKAKLEAQDEDAEDEDAERVRKMLTQQITQFERVKTSLEKTRELWDQRIEQLGDAEPSDEDIQNQIKSQIARKLAVASISAVGDKVYVACSESVGYGYCVWAISDDFESGEELVGDLRGCCGQMDVQANAQGIYVAENSRDRVICYGFDGEEVVYWGHAARDGIRGFGSCCNPMNVAFGPQDTVYTAESGTGRIKQYSSKGELLQVVGSADLVPGCKKVSIGVSHDGNRVFMLDITRDHIVMMDRIPADERAAMVAQAAAAEKAANEPEEDEAKNTQASTTAIQVLRALVPAN
ncbi:NHL repeat-containing protein [Aeoliella mucimassa]|uniref:SMP-30/Gluconolaconase/LRE-like region n=1 Tax=Aeoliella mucimassa TaxID=2527972 RepID=A0A518AI33_9BACT|nr:hypothetical protein [Aeoliella mucimassa]QDU54387.1 hypothetical protein Pan181_05680 [Aeoliella mucimassa]